MTTGLLPYIMMLLGAFGMIGAGGDVHLDRPAKKLKGTYMDQAGLFDQVKGEQPCRVDSGGGVVITLNWEQENPQFGEETESKLLLYFDDLPTPGKKQYLVPGESLLCYQERGKLLMFETFQGQGWIRFDSGPEGGKLKGELEVNLVEPHHNFSNSDFQYLGCDFVLKQTDI